MFSVKEYLDKPYNVDFFEAIVGGDTFRIRRMDGKERIVFNAIEQPYERVLFIVSNCLMDGDTNRNIGDSDAERFISQYGVLATKLALEVIRLNDEAYEAEFELIEEAEKNLRLAAGSGDTVATAVATE